MNKPLKILFVFGTRPEVIKMAPVIKECRRHPERIIAKVCVTGQHRQMIDPLLDLFEIPVDYDLNIMQENQNLDYITNRVLNEVGQLLDAEKADYLLVQGDTTSAMAASLAAYYRKVKIGHVEAGLRTHDKLNPYPEEVNRRIIDSVSDLFFAHTANAKENLLREGVADQLIEITGNTVIDALLETVHKPLDKTSIPWDESLWKGRKLILVTAHRRENFGQPIQNICQAIKQMAVDMKNEVVFVYPVHLNPNIQNVARPALSGLSNVVLTEPLEYLPMVHLMQKSTLVLTDSGGLQEEAPSLGKPVLVMRQTTERPEGVAAGCVEVIGTETEQIVRKVTDLLSDHWKYERMSKAANPYGDGKASQRIVRRLLKEI